MANHMCILKTLQRLFLDPCLIFLNSTVKVALCVISKEKVIFLYDEKDVCVCNELSVKGRRMKKKVTFMQINKSNKCKDISFNAAALS